MQMHPVRFHIFSPFATSHLWCLGTWSLGIADQTWGKYGRYSKEVCKSNFRQYRQMRWEESGKRREKKRGSEKRKSQKKEDAGARKGRKVAKHGVFSNALWLRRVGKVGSPKPRVRRHQGRWEMRNCTPLWREARFQVKMLKTLHFRTTVRRCRKSARRCGAKHAWNSKCTRHLSVGALLGVKMCEKCSELWREAHFEVKIGKAHQVRSTFGRWDVQKVHGVVARSTFRSKKC